MVKQLVSLKAYFMGGGAKLEVTGAGTSGVNHKHCKRQVLKWLHNACCVLRSPIFFYFDHKMCQELSFPGQRWVESSLGTLTSSQEERLKDINKGDFLTHGLVESMLTGSNFWLGASNQVFCFPTFIHNKQQELLDIRKGSHMKYRGRNK